MYTIKEAAARTGVSVPVLRAWERRYGIVEPARTPSGYRMYDEAALARLRSMRRLVDEGWSPSIAAGAILDGSVATDLAPDEGRLRPASAAASTPDADTAVDRFLAGAASLDARDIEAALDDMFAATSFERATEDRLLPALHRLGDAWATGRIDVAGEHLASHAVLRRLAAAFQAAAVGQVDHDGPILVGLPPGARHELGGLIFAIGARRAGLPVVYLGADLPVADWLAAVERTRARAVVIGAVTREDGASAGRVALELRRRNPGLIVAFGGAAAPRPTDRGWPEPPAVRLPESVRPAVDALAAELIGRSETG